MRVDDPQEGGTKPIIRRGFGHEVVEGPNYGSELQAGALGVSVTVLLINEKGKSQ